MKNNREDEFLWKEIVEGIKYNNKQQMKRLRKKNPLA